MEQDRIRSLALRILGRMASFDPAAVPPDDVAHAIGVYDAGEGTVRVWVTTEGVVRDPDRSQIRYDSMAEVHAPTSKSRGDRDSTRIRLILDGGSQEILEVAGGHGRFCDSFEFSRFLSRAAGAYRE